MTYLLALLLCAAPAFASLDTTMSAKGDTTMTFTWGGWSGPYDIGTTARSADMLHIVSGNTPSMTMEMTPKFLAMYDSTGVAFVVYPDGRICVGSDTTDASPREIKAALRRWALWYMGQMRESRTLLEAPRAKDGPIIGYDDLLPEPCLPYGAPGDYKEAPR